MKIDWPTIILTAATGALFFVFAAPFTRMLEHLTDEVWTKRAAIKYWALRKAPAALSLVAALGLGIWFFQAPMYPTKLDLLACVFLTVMFIAGAIFKLIAALMISFRNLIDRIDDQASAARLRGPEPGSTALRE